MQSYTTGCHVAIIMDGNGRWAAARGLPRSAGHAAGAAAVRGVVEAAPALAIRTLTLFAFSAANWRRPDDEVAALMRLMESYLIEEADRCREQGVRLSLVGRRDRLPPSLRTVSLAAERATRSGARLHLRLAVDYSAREALLSAARSLAANLWRDNAAGTLSEAFAGLVRGDESPDVDLLIRTGGEQRLSDFLLWEAAFAELHFTDRMWPEFGPDDLAAAVRDFERRERRFGAIPASAAQEVNLDAAGRAAQQPMEARTAPG